MGKEVIALFNSSLENKHCVTGGEPHQKTQDSSFHWVGSRYDGWWGALPQLGGQGTSSCLQAACLPARLQFAARYTYHHIMHHSPSLGAKVCPVFPSLCQKTVPSAGQAWKCGYQPSLAPKHSSNTFSSCQVQHIPRFVGQGLTCPTPHAHRGMSPTLKAGKNITA